MKTYEVNVTRDGRWWMIEIPELDGLTQARRLDDVEKMAREYIAVTLDVPLSHVAVSVSGIEVDAHDLLETKALVDELRKRVKEVEEMAAAVTHEVAASLIAASVPVRDVGKVLGISHQRVSQIVRSNMPPKVSRLARAIIATQDKSAVAFVVHLQPGSTTEVIGADSMGSPRKVAAKRTDPQLVPRGISRKAAAAGSPAPRSISRPSVAGRPTSNRTKSR